VDNDFEDERERAGARVVEHVGVSGSGAGREDGGV